MSGDSLIWRNLLKRFTGLVLSCTVFCTYTIICCAGDIIIFANLLIPPFQNNHLSLQENAYPPVKQRSEKENFFSSHSW